MNASTLRAAVAVLTVATAGIHLALVPPMAAALGPASTLPFLLNAAGYLAFLAAFWFKPAFLAGRERWVNLAFIGFTAVTVAAYFAVNGGESFSKAIGLADKLIEAALMAALWQHQRTAAA